MHYFRTIRMSSHIGWYVYQANRYLSLSLSTQP